MGVVVQFDYDLWITQYPEFTPYVPAHLAQTYFTVATTLHRNDGGGPVNNTTDQSNFLNMVVAHIAALFGPQPPSGQPASPLVGRINSASEGSVSVQTDWPSANMSSSQAFWVQSKYGALYWFATAPFRTFRYLPGPQRRFDPWPWSNPTPMFPPGPPQG